MPINPFEPYGLASSKTYKGREREIQQIRSIIEATATNTARHFLVTGARGSGKSSLVRNARDVAREMRLIPAYCSIDPSTSLKDLFEQIAEAISLEREKLYTEASDKNNLLPRSKDLLDRLTNRLKSLQKLKVGLAGVEVDLGKAAEMAADSIITVTYALCSVLDDLVKLAQSLDLEPVTGLVLLLDEADMGDPKRLQLGRIIKILAEVLDLREQKNIAIGLSGLPNILDNLLESHKSSLRSFERIHLSELGEEDLQNILKSCCESSNEAVHISPTAEKKLIELAEGYAHWLRHFASKAFEAAAARLVNPIIIELKDVESAEVSAIREIGDSYFKYDFNQLDEIEKSLILALAGTRREEGDIGRLTMVLEANISEDFILEISYKLHEKLILDFPRFKGSRAYLDFYSDVYRRWIELFSLEQKISDPLPHLDHVLEELEKKGAHGFIVISGEDQSAFQEFKNLMKQDTLKWRQIRLNFSPFHHNDLFESFPAVGSVDRLLIEAMLSKWAATNTVASYLTQVEKNRSHEDSHFFSQIWPTSDIIAIPHYMLGYARARGIVSFDEVLADCVDLNVKRTRNFLSTFCMAFDETCTYRGEWVAIPHTVLSKVLFHRGDLTDEHQSWDQIFEKCAVGESKSPICEDQVGKISLWYEWQTTLAASNASIFSRQIGEDLPIFSVEFGQLKEAIETKNVPWMKSNILYSAFKNFWQLVSSQKISDQGESGWFDAQRSFLDDASAENYVCFSGWSDCAGELLNRRSSNGSNIQVRAWPFFNSSNGRGAAPQALDGWVFVIPERPEGRRGVPILPSRPTRANVNVSSGDLAKLILATLRRDWQRQFHERSGCSPLRSVFNKPSQGRLRRTQRSASSLEGGVIRTGSIVQRSIYESKAKGKSTLEYLRMRAELDFISCLCYTREDNKCRAIASEDDLINNLLSIFLDFERTLREIQEADERCEAWIATSPKY